MEAEVELCVLNVILDSLRWDREELSELVDSLDQIQEKCDNTFRYGPGSATRLEVTCGLEPS